MTRNRVKWATLGKGEAMRGGRRLLTLLGAVGVAAVLTSVALAVTVTWGTAIQVPGMAGLGPFGARVDSVSCPTPGNCTAGGVYGDTAPTRQAYVVDEHNGVWGTAQEVPGTAALNVSYADVRSISCASAGNCVAGGFYTADNGGFADMRAFFAEERGGVWGTAKEVPGTRSLSGSDAIVMVTSVSCASAGNCAAVGIYVPQPPPHKRPGQQVFVVAEKNGVWGTAKMMPGMLALNVGLDATADSVSCGSAGNCAVVGYYSGVNPGVVREVFVEREVNGVWGVAKGLPSVASLNTGGQASFSSVSCATAGSCAAGGYYTAGYAEQAVVATLKKGVWSTNKLPSAAALNAGRYAGMNSVSCASAGNCTAVGYYATSSQKRSQPFVVSETNGVWGNAKKLLGTTGSTDGSFPYPSSVSCASPGNCAVAGSYTDAASKLQVFVARETNGVWAKATQVPGTAALNLLGYAQVSAVSCAKLGTCAIGGAYSGYAGKNMRAFVTSP
jgi:hypothetical protein